MVNRRQIENDVLNDILRLKRIGTSSHYECKKVLEEKDTDVEYRNYLLFLLDEAILYESSERKRKRKRGIVCVMENFDVVNDPPNVVNNKAGVEKLMLKDKRHLYQMPDRRRSCRRVVEEKFKMNESHKRKRGNGYVDEAEDFDDVNDPAYVANYKVGADKFMRRDKGHCYQMPGRRYSCVAEGLCKKCVYRAQHSEENKVYMHQSGKGKNIVCENGGYNKRREVLSDNEQMHQEPSLENNWLMPCQSEHVDRVQSVVRYKEQFCAKSKGRNKVKVEHEANNQLVAWADDENFHQGLRKDWVVCKHGECVNRPPGKKVDACDERDLMKMGQGLHGCSQQKSAFGNYSVNNRTDNGAKTRLDKEGLHNKTMNVKTAFVKDMVNCRELTIIGQGDIGVSHQQGTIGNCSVKNQHYVGVKTRLQMTKYRNGTRSVENSSGKDMVNSRELVKVGQGDLRLSHQQAPIGNYFVKNETDNVVRTQLQTQAVQDKTRNVETTSMEDVINGQRNLTKIGQGDRGLSYQRAYFGNHSLKNEPNESVKTRLLMGEAQIKTRSLTTSKRFLEYSKGLETINEGINILNEIEIIDVDAFTERMVIPAVPSTTHHCLPEPGCPSKPATFREELLKILSKPYDVEEYKQHREAIRIGSYYKHYPDLQKKLAVHKFKRKKCLTILRGFFFWLKNVSREGSFRPWKDRECIAVVPGSP